MPARRARPDFVFGLPFPAIDPVDPDAGVKVMWNRWYTVYKRTQVIVPSHIHILGRGGLVRDVEAVTTTVAYTGREGRPLPNPEKTEYREIVLADRAELRRRDRHAHLALQRRAVGLALGLPPALPARAPGDLGQPFRRPRRLRRDSRRRARMGRKEPILHLEAHRLEGDSRSRDVTRPPAVARRANLGRTAPSGSPATTFRAFAGDTRWRGGAARPGRRPTSTG